jgi:dihydrofolate reductase
MRKVTFGAANSLDNFIARTDGDVSWLMWNNEVSSIVAEFWQTIDTIVMGRKTYEASLVAGSSTFGGIKTYVFSRTLKPGMTRSVEIVTDDVVSFLRRLKSQNGKGICVMGGGLLAKPLFAVDLIDEVGCNIHPVLLGSGIPLFHEQKQQIDLELLECRPLKNGCVTLMYRVKHKS